MTRKRVFFAFLILYIYQFHFFYKKNLPAMKKNISANHISVELEKKESLGSDKLHKRSKLTSVEKRLNDRSASIVSSDNGEDNLNYFFFLPRFFN